MNTTDNFCSRIASIKNMCDTEPSVIINGGLSSRFSNDGSSAAALMKKIWDPSNVVNQCKNKLF